jgi:(R,R)-butanediol dehydrogenase/meso-butanediol dehydrogenase/diacetyl reductase
VGTGAVGLMAVQAAAAFGADGVAVVESLPERRALAIRLGAARAVPPGEAGALEADVAVECAGTASPIQTALQALRSAGRAVLLSIVTESAPIAPMDLVRGEKSLIGSLSHVWDQDFREALQLLGRRAVQAAPLITDRIPLSAAVTGGLALLRDETGKAPEDLGR